MTVIVDFAHKIGIESEVVRDFYQKNWHRQIALTNQKFYEWQFKNLPTSFGKDHCVIAYDQTEREILGIMGLNPRPFSLKGSWIDGAEMTTWVVSKERRTSGTGLKILQFAQSKFDVLIGMGITDVALVIYLKLGFSYTRSIPRFIKILNWERVVPILNCTPLFLKLSQSRKEIVKEIACIVHAFDENIVDEVFHNFRSRYNLFSRDYSHLEWRYNIHPIFKYKIMIVETKNNGAKALLCFREETSLEQIKILHILDCFGEDDAIQAALSYIENYARAYFFDAIDFYSTASCLNKILRGSYWFSATDDYYFQFPHLFHPIEFRNPPTTSLAVWSHHHFLDLCDFSNLYFTKQDADLDRPTLYEQ